MYSIQRTYGTLTQPKIDVSGLNHIFLKYIYLDSTLNAGAGVFEQAPSRVLPLLCLSMYSCCPSPLASGARGPLIVQSDIALAASWNPSQFQCCKRGGVPAEPKSAVPVRSS